MEINESSLSDGMDDDGGDCLAQLDQPMNDSVQCQSDYYAQQISLEQYNQQTAEYTKSSVNALVSSPEYQRMYTRCRLCWCTWSEGQCSEQCSECGGFAMTRPCPICQGRCGAIWRRDVDLSHSNMEAHWDGECILPADQRQAFLAQMLISSTSNENIFDDFSDLTTT